MQGPEAGQAAGSPPLAQPLAPTLLFSRCSRPRPCFVLPQVTLDVVGGFLVLAGLAQRPQL